VIFWATTACRLQPLNTLNWYKMVTKPVHNGYMGYGWIEVAIKSWIRFSCQKMVSLNFLLFHWPTLWNSRISYFTKMFSYFLVFVSWISQVCQFAYFTRSRAIFKTYFDLEISFCMNMLVSISIKYKNPFWKKRYIGSFFYVGS